MPRDIPIKFKWSEQYLLTEELSGKGGKVFESLLFTLWGRCMALHVSCCWVSNTSVEPGEQELLWSWGQARLRVAEREMRLEHKRLFLIICIGNIVWFSSVCSQSVCLFSALGNFCEDLLMLHKLGKRHGVCFSSVYLFLLCFVCCFVFSHLMLEWVWI